MSHAPLTIPETLARRDAAEARLLARINYERADDMPYRGQGLKLARMRELMGRLGNPEQRLKIVHVAGTKGKGSVSTTVASILQAAGLKTGLFTSPHLDSAEERIITNGRPCSPETYTQLVERVWPHVLEMDEAAARQGGTGPTYFEITTAMALLEFARGGAEAVVLEVGLGGRLDSTNICQPVVSVITTISFDHMKQLGNTLTAIAGEKAGIIKPGVPVVSGVITPEPATVIRQKAAELSAPLVELDQDFRYTYRPPQLVVRASGGPSSGQIDFEYAPRSEGGTEPLRWRELDLNLLGEHQGLNAAVALAVVEQLRRQAWNISEEAVRLGLKNTVLPARVEIVQQQPTVIIDAAHNVASIKALVETLRNCFPAGPQLLLFATTRDKDVPGMLRELLPAFDEVVFTRYLNNPRGVPPEELQAIAASLGYPGKITFDGPQAAWDWAKRHAAAEQLICLTGSFFFAAEMRRLIRAETSVV